MQDNHIITGLDKVGYEIFQLLISVFHVYNEHK